MLIQSITIFPEMFSALTEYGVTSRALCNQLWQFRTINPRDFADNKLGYIDDRPFGGGPGMVMQAPPLQAALDDAKDRAPNAQIVYLSPQGQPLNHSTVMRLAQQDLILLCGRYEGVDERILMANDIEEVCVGDFVVSGGELPAMMLMDAVLRFLPEVLGDERSAQEDSFVSGLLDCPHYTRPINFRSLTVPSVLLSGNHSAIKKWRQQQSLLRTRERRPDLWTRYCLTPQESRLVMDEQLDDSI